MSEKSLTDILLGFDDIAPHQPDTREYYTKTPWSWPGSKYKSLAKILPELPYTRAWVDVCFGTGVVTLNRRPSEFEVYNDRYSGITDFYQVVRDSNGYDKLLERLKTVLYSREEFIWSKETWQNCDDPVERAARWYYMIRCSFNQIGRNFGRSLKDNMLPAKYWRGLKLFPHMHHRLQQGQVENLDAVQCIKDYDAHDVVFYIDPDYEDTDQGLYQFGVNHQQLIDTVLSAKGFCAISGYPNSLYDSYEWDKRITWEVATSVRAQTNTDFKLNRQLKQTEVLWIKDFH